MIKLVIGLIKWIIIVVFVVIVVWFYLWQKRDYTSLSLRLNNDIKSVLINAGITDRDFIRQYHNEKKEKRYTWIETTRGIQRTLSC